MKINPVYQKEWLKLGRYVLALAAIALILGGYFWFELVHHFNEIDG